MLVEMAFSQRSLLGGRWEGIVLGWETCKYASVSPSVCQANELVANSSILTMSHQYFINYALMSELVIGWRGFHRTMRTFSV